MTNLFLLNESISDISFSNFQIGLDDLILLDSSENDFFHKHSSIYNLDNYLKLCQDFSQSNQARIKYLEQLNNSTNNPKSIEDLKAIHPRSAVGFLGVDFPQLYIDQKLCVNNKESFDSLRAYYIRFIDFNNFNFLKKFCFPKITFCGHSEAQLTSYGSGKKFYQCLEQFSILQEYLNNWEDGDFSYQNLKASTAIDLSPESKSTMDKYSQERVFQLPDGGTDVFELHIKLGDIRIHILEDNPKKMMMIGYIGSHLNT